MQPINLEESENLCGERMATIRGSRGGEFVVNLDALAFALVNSVASRDHEERTGWKLTEKWFVNEWQTIVDAALAAHRTKTGGENA